MNDPLWISIIGRNEIDCQGLKHILKIGGFTIDQCVRDSPYLSFESWKDDLRHLVIIDSVSEQAALALCAKMRATISKARILLLSEQCEIETVRQAFAIEVDGVVARDIGSEALISVVGLVALGEKVFPSQLIDALTNDIGTPAASGWNSHISLAHFSEREIEILRCLVGGESNKIIGRKLGVSEATVKAHVKTILRKLQLGNRTQAAIWAVSRGLDQEDEGTEPPSEARRAPRRNGIN